MTGTDRRDIHEGIAEWHENGPDGVELHTFLGLTWEQYGLWVEGGPLPKGSPWYDGVRHAMRQKQDRNEQRLSKQSRRKAQAELALLHRSEYMKLLDKHRRALEAEAAEALLDKVLRDGKSS